MITIDAVNAAISRSRADVTMHKLKIDARTFHVVDYASDEETFELTKTQRPGDVVTGKNAITSCVTTYLVISHAANETTALGNNRIKRLRNSVIM